MWRASAFSHVGSRMCGCRVPVLMRLVVSSAAMPVLAKGSLCPNGSRTTRQALIENHEFGGFGFACSRRRRRPGSRGVVAAPCGAMIGAAAAAARRRSQLSGSHKSDEDAPTTKAHKRKELPPRIDTLGDDWSAHTEVMGPSGRRYISTSLWGMHVYDNPRNAGALTGSVKGLRR